MVIWALAGQCARFCVDVREFQAGWFNKNVAAEKVGAVHSDADLTPLWRLIPVQWVSPKLHVMMLTFLSSLSFWLGLGFLALMYGFFSYGWSVYFFGFPAVMGIYFGAFLLSGSRLRDQALSLEQQIHAWFGSIIGRLLGRRPIMNVLSGITLVTLVLSGSIAWWLPGRQEKPRDFLIPIVTEISAKNYWALLGVQPEDTYLEDNGRLVPFVQGATASTPRLDWLQQQAHAYLFNNFGLRHDGYLPIVINDKGLSPST